MMICGLDQWTNIPSGWRCNGNNGTPDLRNKFILGVLGDSVRAAYPAVAPGETGGYEDQIVVSHSHTINNHTPHSVQHKF